MTIPNDFNPTVSNDPSSDHVGWYEVRFPGPSEAAGRSWSIEFEGVRRNAQVWLNGRMIGSNADPYAPFTLPASSLIPQAPNVLTVRVDDHKNASTLPEDWWNWGGITGPVQLAPLGRLAVYRLGVLPQLGCSFHCGSLLVQGAVASISASSATPRLVITVTTPGGRIVKVQRVLPTLNGGSPETFSVQVPVPGPVDLWSPASPTLYSVRVRLRAQGEVAQERSLRVGMRSVHVRAGILYLNGHRLWLHGAAIHEDMKGRGAALTNQDIATIVSQLRAVGANVTRAHYLLSERLLDALDAAGIMVWEQPPVDHADGILQSPGGRARALTELTNTIIGARNHPSVIVDSVGNELTPSPNTTPGTNTYLNNAIALARRLNPTVPVALDIYCYPGYPKQSVYSKLDLLGISDYYGWYTGTPGGHSIAQFSALQPYLTMMHARYPRQGLVVSEYGAEGLFNAPASVKGSYSFQSDYLRRTLQVVNGLPFMNGSIYWTLREFAVGPGWTGGATLPSGTHPDGLHHKGLIAYDGQKKPAFAVASQLLRIQPSFVR